MKNMTKKEKLAEISKTLPKITSFFKPKSQIKLCPLLPPTPITAQFGAGARHGGGAAVSSMEWEDDNDDIMEWGEQVDNMEWEDVPSICLGH